MKLVINKCYGGFGLSALAVKRLAELQGRQIFFFKSEYNAGSFEYHPVEIEDLSPRDIFHTFDCEIPPKVLSGKAWQNASEAERLAANKEYEDHVLELDCSLERNDPLLVQVVEELGEKANGGYAELRIVEIPDGIEYVISDYDGVESIHERHRSW